MMQASDRITDAHPCAAGYTGMNALVVAAVVIAIRELPMAARQFANPLELGVLVEIMKRTRNLRFGAPHLTEISHGDQESVVGGPILAGRAAERSRT
ncbi:hypothetical protein XAB3213_490005 [Xanthomonas citri pv. bilvae]|nr:hypothetical protein XAB3213_490005 [Xanthomonas citri pv. bilvae]